MHAPGSAVDDQRNAESRRAHGRSAQIGLEAIAVSSKSAHKPLSGNQRRHLRALAHPLKPVVQIGNAGVTAGVLREIDRALETHELVKVRVSDDCPVEIDEAGRLVEKETRSELAQIIGKILVVYRRRQKDPKITLPRPRKPA